MTIPKRPAFIQSKDVGTYARHAEADHQRLEHVMTLLESILETMRRIEEQGKPFRYSSRTEARAAADRHLKEILN